MTRFELGCVTALIMAMGSAACAAPALSERTASRQRHAVKDAEDGSDEDASSAALEADDDPAPKGTGTTSSSAEEAEDSAIRVTFAASAGQRFGDVRVYRSCSDMGVDFNQASFADATSLSLVNVVDREVLATVEGKDFEALKTTVVSGTGQLEIPVDASAVPTAGAEYAIVMGGDSRFGSPAACGASIQPKDDEDRGVKGSAGRFPTGRVIAFDRGIGGKGCGIVGFLQAYRDADNGTIYARPSSPLIIAAGATMDDGRIVPVVDVWFERHF